MTLLHPTAIKAEERMLNDVNPGLSNPLQAWTRAPSGMRAPLQQGL
jgi:hypothetical protein